MIPIDVIEIPISISIFYTIVVNISPLDVPPNLVPDAILLLRVVMVRRLLVVVVVVMMMMVVVMWQ